MRACMHACVRACVCACLRARVRARMRAWVGGSVRGFVGAWVRGCVGAWVRIRARTCVCTCVCASARAHVCGRCACVYVRARARAVTQSSVRGDSCGASRSRDDSIRKISTRASLLNRRTCDCARARVGVNVCALCTRACIEFESARYHVCVDTLHGRLSLHRTFDGACDRTLDGNIPSSAHVGQAASSLLRHVIYHDVPAVAAQQP